ncbi:MAG: (2Fe-2S) ferredoxin domain-containing protein [Phormidesmis sp.]
MPRTVLVCKNTTCSQQGSAKVLAAFDSHKPHDVTVKPSGCLGQCGSGPMVLVEPDKVWYSRVRPQDVPTIVSKHLQGGKRVTEKLYPVFHPPPQSQKGWLVVGGVLLGLAAVLFGAVLFSVMASQSYYF